MRPPRGMGRRTTWKKSWLGRAGDLRIHTRADGGRGGRWRQRQNAGTRFSRDCKGERGGPCWRNLGMDGTQALRASLANRRVSDEDCFMILEPNPLGFHVRAQGGHDDSAAPGAARARPTILATKSLSGVCGPGCSPQQSLWFILQSSSRKLKGPPRAENRKPPPLTWPRGQEGICVLRHTSSASSHYVSTVYHHQALPVTQEPGQISKPAQRKWLTSGNHPFSLHLPNPPQMETLLYFH